MDIAFFQLLTTSVQWQANFDVRTCTDFRTAVALRCQHDRKHALSYQTLMAVPAPIFSIFDLKKHEPTNVKIKENRKQPGTLQMTLKSFPWGEKVNKNFIFLYFTFLEPLCLGKVFFSPKPFFVKMCVFAAP